MRPLLHRPVTWRSPGGRRRLYGFTLLEMMVVVIIIGILATIAVPTLLARIRSARTREAANQIGLLYTSARLHAMGRGAAVLVRYDGSTNHFEVREAITGNTAGGCQMEPTSSCENNWNTPSGTGPTTWSSVKSLTFTNGAYRDLSTQMYLENVQQTTLDLCFTPMGRSFVRSGTTGVFLVNSGIYDVDVFRVSGGQQDGLRRRVAVLPNGTTEVLTAEDGAR